MTKLLKYLPKGMPLFLPSLHQDSGEYLTIAQGIIDFYHAREEHLPTHPQKELKDVLNALQVP